MHKTEPARAVPKGLTCPNCDAPMGLACEFETVLICPNCRIIAERLVEMCKRDLDKTLDVYKRILVAAIKEKKLHLQNAETAKKAAMHDPV
jgi:hypothetical protein